MPTSLLDPLGRTIAEEAGKLVLGAAWKRFCDWLGRFRLGARRAGVLAQGAAALNRLLELANGRIRLLDSLLGDVTQLLMREGVDFSEALHFIMRRLLGSMPIMFSRSAYCRLALLTPVNEQAPAPALELRIRVGHNYSLDGTENLGLKADSIAGMVFTTGKPAYIPNVTKDPRFAISPHRKHPYYTLLCVPVSVKGTPTAVLNIDADQVDALTPDDQDLAKLIARMFEHLLTLELAKRMSG